MFKEPKIPPNLSAYKRLQIKYKFLKDYTMELESAQNMDKMHECACCKQEVSNVVKGSQYNLKEGKLITNNYCQQCAKTLSKLGLYFPHLKETK